MSPRKIILNEFKDFRKTYRATRYPIVLCHGLMGFDDMTLFGDKLKYSYWGGIREELEARGARVLVPHVPPVATIEERARIMHEQIVAHARELEGTTEQAEQEGPALSGDAGGGHNGGSSSSSSSGGSSSSGAGGAAGGAAGSAAGEAAGDTGSETSVGKVNLIGHSMGGLDGRYLISKLRPRHVEVLSLTTVATPHHGTALADAYLALSARLPAKLGAFAQLSTPYMREQFNPEVKDRPEVAYYSYGARFYPTWQSPLRLPWGILKKREGDNDGLVSVDSAVWGSYQGTLENCDHLDVINMTRFKPMHLRNRNYKAAAMYLHVMDELAAKGF